MTNHEQLLIDRLKKNIINRTNSGTLTDENTKLGPSFDIPIDIVEYESLIIPKEITDNNDNPNYEMVNHPQHYNNYDVEVVDMMEKIWGTKTTMNWCKLTAFKYRMRMGTKPDNTINQDLEKEQWYLNKANELKSKLKC